MEDRGEVRGGRFVGGFLGEQFTLPEAVELLRSVRRSERSGEEIKIAPADPLNLSGIILPGARISALAGGLLRLRDGVPIPGKSFRGHDSSPAGTPLVRPVAG